MTKSSGTLYLVATPIGNLEDITQRALRILREADFVYCEDTRRTLILLNTFKIERKNGLESFHDHSSRGVLQKIRRALEEGKSVAYVTDGGMPVVSDPGFVLVREALACEAPVVVVPGPSAGPLLFAASGLPSPKYFFHGFFPRVRGEVERALEVVKTNPVVHLFYEAPGRITASLEVLNRNCPDSQVVLGRELTKVHEEILRGTAAEVYENIAAREKVKGECVLAVMGGEPEREKARPERISGTSDHPDNLTAEDSAPSEVTLTAEQQAEIAALIQSGVSSKDAAKTLSKKFKMSRRVIYEFIIRRLT